MNYNLWLCIRLIMLLVFICSSQVFASETQTLKAVRGATTFSFSASYLHQFNANIDNGMSFKVNRGLFKADIKTMQNEGLYTGIGINYDLLDYSFKDKEANTTLKPWSSIQDINISASLLYNVDKNIRLFLAPSFGVSSESGANLGDSLVYGASGWASYRISPTIVLGLGAGVYKKPDKTSVYPIVIIDWAITDNLRLSNPLTPGPTGPAGLELSYKLSNDFKMGIGGAYKSVRFRLDDNDYLKEGIGEDRGFPMWIRLSHRAFKSGALDLLVGAMLGGRLKIEDMDGNDLMREKYKPAPFVAVTLTIKI